MPIVFYNNRSTLALVILLAVLVTGGLGGRRLCGTSLYLHLVRVCTFGYEKTPCFKSRFPGSSSSVRSSEGRSFAGIANKCCEQGCTVLDLRATCCFKLSCLRQCYPESEYRRRTKTASDSQLKLV